MTVVSGKVSSSSVATRLQPQSENSSVDRKYDCSDDKKWILDDFLATYTDFSEYLLTVERFVSPRARLVNLESIQILLCFDKLGGLRGAPREVIKLQPPENPERYLSTNAYPGCLYWA